MQRFPMFLVAVLISVPALCQAGDTRYLAGCADDAAAVKGDPGGASADQVGADGATADERGTVKGSKSNSSERGTVKSGKSNSSDRGTTVKSSKSNSSE